ncbi:Hypothetical predicted protein, partial [Pelobates cultripes]
APTPVKLTMTVSQDAVNFLDVHIFKKEMKLGYTLFTKTTDRNTLLQADSFHPRHLKESLPLSQFLRVKRNNSDPMRACLQTKETWNRFKQRGYKDATLQKLLVPSFPL